MVYSVGAEKIASALAESVRPRYVGPPANIGTLESLIIKGVNKIGGQAVKGTVFRFDCSKDGVSVSVDEKVEGIATSAGLGSAFVDVYMDDNTVSPTLVDSCVHTWSDDEAKSIAVSLLELSSAVSLSANDKTAEEQTVKEDVGAKRRHIESKLQPIQEYATGISFAPVLGEGLYLVGCGVRKKSIIKIYAVAMYSSAVVINEATSKALGNTARSFDASTPVTSFVLEMVYSVGAEKIASALAESVRPRYGGSPSDISTLESLIIEGVNKIGGQAVKGTIFRFDCSKDGVSVSVAEKVQGVAASKELGSAFVNVFMDDNSVSPTLVDSCVNTWSDDEAKSLAASLLEVSLLIRGKLSGDLQSTQVSRFDKERQDLGATGPTMRKDHININDVQPQSAQIEVASAELFRQGQTSINQIAKIRARNTFLKQQELIFGAVQSVQNHGTIKEKASDRAAERLRFVASHVENDKPLFLFGGGFSS